MPVFGKGLPPRRRGSCSTNNVERDDDSKIRHPALASASRHHCLRAHRHGTRQAEQALATSKAPMNGGKRYGTLPAFVVARRADPDPGADLGLRRPALRPQSIGGRVERVAAAPGFPPAPGSLRPHYYVYAFEAPAGAVWAAASGAPAGGWNWQPGSRLASR